MTSSPKQNLAESIFQDLTRRILSGELAPGERLPPERDLAARYGGSRNTLREAIRKLEQMRLVKVRHGAGVTILDAKRTGTLGLLGAYLEHTPDLVERVKILEDLLLARTMVLEMALTIAAERSLDSDIERLRAIATAQRQRLERGERDALIRGELETLEAIVDAAHSLTVRWAANTLLEVYRGFLDRFPELFVVEPSLPDYLDTLCNALSRRDAATAVDALRHFTARADRALRETLSFLKPTASTPRELR